jgi:hypothetical protein
MATLKRLQPKAKPPESNEIKELEADIVEAVAANLRLTKALIEPLPKPKAEEVSYFFGKVKPK